MEGAIFAVSVHLFYCVCVPSELVEIRELNGALIPSNQVVVQIDTIHRIEIGIAAIIYILVGLRSFWTFWTKPDH